MRQTSQSLLSVAGVATVATTAFALDFNTATMPPETVLISAPELLITCAFAPSPLIHARHCYGTYVLLGFPYF